MAKKAKQKWIVQENHYIICGYYLWLICLCIICGLEKEIYRE
jgi:hypothetical protein